MDFAGLEMQWRELFERHAGNLISDLSAHLHQSLDTAIHEVEFRTRNTTHRELAESLNQALRRVRQSPTWQDALALLTDSTSAYCRRSAVFTLGETMADAVHTRGLNGLLIGELPHVPLAEAAAFRTAIETKDPVVAIASASELSSALAQAIGPLDVSDSVYLFPIVARQQALGLLVAAGSVQPAPLELLCEMVALKSEASQIPQPNLASPFIQLDAPAAITRNQGSSAWDRLTPEEQALHLQAQRFARVKVAEMRLYHAEAVRQGRTQEDIYGFLDSEIDRARQAFHQNFVITSASMVDYFHLELLRSLAHDNKSLLGPSYPGPLV